MEVSKKQVAERANKAGTAGDEAMQCQSKEKSHAGKSLPMKGEETICRCAPLPSSVYLTSTTGTLWATTQLANGFCVGS